MDRIHRIVLGSIVGGASLLGVAALAQTSDLGGGSEPQQATIPAASVPAAPDAAAARRELEDAQADFARALAEQGSVPSPAVASGPTVTVPAAVGGDDRYEDDDDEYDDDRYDDDHGDEDDD